MALPRLRLRSFFSVATMALIAVAGCKNKMQHAPDPAAPGEPPGQARNPILPGAGADAIAPAASTSIEMGALAHLCARLAA